MNSFRDLARRLVSRSSARATRSASRRRHAFGRPAGQAVRAVLCLCLLTQGLLASTAPAAAAKPAAKTAATQGGPQNSKLAPPQTATAVLADLAREEALNPQGPDAGETFAIPPPRPLPYDEDPNAGGEVMAPSSGLSGQPGETDPLPQAPSPAPAQSYHAQEDIGRVPTTTRFIPPDIHGAVGLTRSMSVTNNNYRVYDKATGAPVSTVGIQTFWSPLAPHPGGDNGLFDPRVQYDPYNDRFIHWVLAGSITANNELLVAVSQTGDPNGAYNYYSFVVGTSNLGADFPTVGFNKNWLVVGLNMFAVAAGGVTQGNVITIDYPAARSGAPSPTAVRFVTPDNTFFFGTGLCPTDTYDPAEGTMYVARNFNNNTTGRLQLYKITGTPSSPAASVVNEMVNSGDFWNTGSEGNFLPQLNTSSTPTAPSSTIGIEAGDARLQNMVYRNGSLWTVHKIGIPATSNTATVRVGVQWWQLSTAGAIIQRGRIEDPTATQANGGSHYAWPSIAVNRNSAVIVNYSEFEEDDYADTGYSFRLPSDPLNTMGDPFIYQQGLDNYAAADGNGRVRWGDYTAAVPDPTEDRDLWVLGEYAHQKVPVTGGFSSRHDTWWAKVDAPTGLGELLIKEFRFIGPAGVNDEFIEVYNNSRLAHTVQSLDASSTGYAIVASDGVIRCTIPNNTVIQPRGHYLCANSTPGTGYSLGLYPAGTGTTATPDVTYTVNIPDDGGVAIFNTTNTTNFSSTTRIDAVGFAGTSALYTEGSPLPLTAPTTSEHSYVRRLPLGCTGGVTGAKCGVSTLDFSTPANVTASLALLQNTPGPATSYPQDSDNNAEDFIQVDTSGAQVSPLPYARLGAPGPENTTSPVHNDTRAILTPNTFTCVGSTQSPNRVRTAGATGTNADYGTLEIRKSFINNTPNPITRLRFRVMDFTTFPSYPQPPYPSPSAATCTGSTCVADMRVLNSSDLVVPNPCVGGNTTLRGSSVETPPAQPFGGGWNSSIVANLATPLAPGQGVDVRFLLGVQQNGKFRFFFTVEALPYQ